MPYPTVIEHHKRYPNTSVMASPYSCDNTGTVDCSASIEQIKSDLSNSGTVVVPKGTYLIDENLTLPAGMLFRFEAGASFSVAFEKVLTVQCDLDFPDSQVCFSGAGTITLGTSFSANPQTLKLPRGTWSVTTNTTIPTNVTLDIKRGAILTVATTKTLTINGFVQAGKYQIFSLVGTGALSFGYGSVHEIYPEWFGAVADGTTNCTTAVQNAFDSAFEGATIRFGGGTYAVSPVSFAKRLHLVGSSCAGYYEYADSARPYDEYPTKIRARGTQASVLTIGDMSMTRKLNGVSIEDISFDGASLEGAYTISTAVLIIKNLANSRFTRMGCRWATGTLLYLEDFWDSVFDSCWFTSGGATDGQAIYIAPLYSNDWGGRNVNNITFNTCHFEGNSGRWFASQEVGGGGVGTGDNSLTFLRIINSKFEIGNGTCTHVSHKSVIYLPYVSGFICNHNQFTNFITGSGYDNLIEIGGYWQYPGQLITDNVFQLLTSGTPSNELYILPLSCPVTFKDNIRTVITATYSDSGFTNTSTYAQPFLYAINNAGTTALHVANAGSIWRSAHDVAFNGLDGYHFVVEATSLSIQGTCFTTDVARTVCKDVSRLYSGYKYDIFMRVRVKRTGAGAVQCLVGVWNGAAYAYTGAQNVTSATWEWLDFTVTSTALATMQHLIFAFTTVTAGTTAEFDGLYYVPTVTAT